MAAPVVVRGFHFPKPAIAYPIRAKPLICYDVSEQSYRPHKPRWYVSIRLTRGFWLWRRNIDLDVFRS